MWIKRKRNRSCVWVASQQCPIFLIFHSNTVQQVSVLQLCKVHARVLEVLIKFCRRRNPSAPSQAVIVGPCKTIIWGVVWNIMKNGRCCEAPTRKNASEKDDIFFILIHIHTVQCTVYIRQNILQGWAPRSFLIRVFGDLWDPKERNVLSRYYF